jgi:hypothetical protein
VSSWRHVLCNKCTAAQGQFYRPASNQHLQDPINDALGATSQQESQKSYGQSGTLSGPLLSSQLHSKTLFVFSRLAIFLILAFVQTFELRMRKD